MTTRIGTDVQFGPDDIHHKYLAASDGHAGFGTVKIGTPGVGGNATLYFQDTALIDAMVTHLAELKTEMLAAQQPEPERVVFTDEDDGEPEGCTCAFAPGVCDAHVKPKAAPVVRIAEPACPFIREYDGQIYPCVLEDDHADEHQDRLAARWWHGDDDSQTVTHAAPRAAGMQSPAPAEHDYVTPAMADRRDGAAAAYEADAQAAGQ